MQNLNKNYKTDLKKRCFYFSVDVVNFVVRPTNFVEQIIFKQLLRCATSIGANIVEAHGSSSKKDFLNFFSIALKSARETLYWLYLIKETGNKNNQDKLLALIAECDELAKIIAASILTMKGKR